MCCFLLPVCLCSFSFFPSSETQCYNWFTTIIIIIITILVTHLHHMCLERRLEGIVKREHCTLTVERQQQLKKTIAKYMLMRIENLPKL